MPYLPVDLDAKRKAEFVDRAHNLPKGTTVGGLLDAWEHVWATKSDVLGELYITACFGSSPAIRADLVTAGFLEQLPEGQWRIRGAAKWLFGMEGKSRGGHAAKSNLVPGAKHKKPKPADEQKEPPSAPAESLPIASRDPPSADPSALSSSIQHPASTFKNLAGKPQKQKGDPRHTPLVAALCAEYRSATGGEYRFEGKDAKAVTRLLASSPDDGEIVRLYAVSVRMREWPGTADMTLFADRWNELLRRSPPPQRKLASGDRQTGPTRNLFVDS